jgi:multidrug efflux pump subunit AcrA (membrane-fusion protein)
VTARPLEQEREEDLRGGRARRWRWPLLALVIVAALGLVGWLTGGSSIPAEDWLQVRRADLSLTLPVTGSLEAVESTRLGPPVVPDTWDFKISFLAPEGAQVRPGQPVVGFDTSQLEQKLAEKMAERDSAQKQLEKRQTSREIAERDRQLDVAEAEARRRKAALKVDVPADLVSAHELEGARRDLALAEREIAYLKEKLRLEDASAATEIASLARQRDRAAERVRDMQAAVESMMVKAPRAGTVVYVSEPDGQKKKVGDSCWRGQSVVEIPDLRQLRAQGEVDEADAGRVAIGQPVHFRLDAHPDLTFEGRVRSIGTTVRARSESDPVKVARIGIDLVRTDAQRMRPGMRFVGTVEIERLPKVLLAPAEAVFNRAGGPVVFRRNGLGSEEVRPEVGKRNERWVEIRRGLAAGDRICRRDLRVEGRGGG